jgi:hypothetical protein
MTYSSNVQPATPAKKLAINEIIPSSPIVVAYKRLGAQLHQTALTASARAETPAARAVPQTDNGELIRPRAAT